ncbi:hypothetical protein [Pararhizobium sp. O133]|uniref:hypothetical protein n=1 Tax=Pararhizobium sp. O133 TaxID=3449278 RepID=UPI003F682AA3
MRDTEQKAKAGMGRFVILILGIALLLAGIYVVFETPGETQGQPSPHAIDQSG